MSLFTIKTGLIDFFRHFQVAILPTDTAIEQASTEKAEWTYLSLFEITIAASNLSRDNTDLQLGNVEREIMRMVCTYLPHSILGIDDMFYVGQERIYGFKDSWAASSWMTRITIRVRYHLNV